LDESAAAKRKQKFRVALKELGLDTFHRLLNDADFAILLAE
jgi:hypothetical protein